MDTGVNGALELSCLTLLGDVYLLRGLVPSCWTSSFWVQYSSDRCCVDTSSSWWLYSIWTTPDVSSNSKMGLHTPCSWRQQHHRLWDLFDLLLNPSVSLRGSGGLTWSRSSDEKTTRPLSSPENSFIPLVLHVKDVMEPLWRPTTSKRRSYRHRKRTFEVTLSPPNISTEFLTCLFRPGSGDTSWKTATRPDAVPTATKSSKHLSSFTAVMASLLPWKHTREDRIWDWRLVAFR